eukprot:941379-Pyramimonas_sp.AAC.1
MHPLLGRHASMCKPVVVAQLLRAMARGARSAPRRQTLRNSKPNKNTREPAARATESWARAPSRNISESREDLHGA